VNLWAIGAIAACVGGAAALLWQTAILRLGLGRSVPGVVYGVGVGVVTATVPALDDTGKAALVGFAFGFLLAGAAAFFVAGILAAAPASRPPMSEVDVREQQRPD